jgi:hypothetical protein
VTNNNGFWIGRFDLLAFLLQLQPIITDHNQYCRRLAPYLTVLRLSSLPLWLNWFWFTSRSLLLLRLPWTTTVLRMENAERRLPRMNWTSSVILLFCVDPLQRIRAYRPVAQQWTIPRLFVATGMCLPNRCLATVVFVKILMRVTKNEVKSYFRYLYYEYDTIFKNLTQGNSGRDATLFVKVRMFVLLKLR